MIELRQKITLILLLSGIYLFGQGSNVKLVDFTSSECSDEPIYSRNYIKRVIEKKKDSSLHTIKIFTITNCSWAEYGDIEFKNDTLNLKYSGAKFENDTIYPNKKDRTYYEVVTYVSEVSECDCGFNLTYKIEGLEDKNYKILANGTAIPFTTHKYKIVNESPKFEIVENDTINLFDIYGLKQGLHIYSYNDRDGGRYVYKDGERISGYATNYNRFKGYDKVEIVMANKRYYLRRYYLNNHLVKECTIKDIFEDDNDCTYFD